MIRRRCPRRALLLDWLAARPAATGARLGASVRVLESTRRRFSRRRTISAGRLHWRRSCGERVWRRSQRSWCRRSTPTKGQPAGGADQRVASLDGWPIAPGTGRAPLANWRQGGRAAAELVRGAADLHYAVLIGYDAAVRRAAAIGSSERPAMLAVFRALPDRAGRWRSRSSCRASSRRKRGPTTISAAAGLKPRPRTRCRDRLRRGAGCWFQQPLACSPANRSLAGQLAAADAYARAVTLRRTMLRQNRAQALPCRMSDVQRGGSPAVPKNTQPVRLAAAIAATRAHRRPIYRQARCRACLASATGPIDRSPQPCCRSATYELRGGVAVITLSNPRSTGFPMRSGRLLRPDRAGRAGSQSVCLLRRSARYPDGPLNGRRRSIAALSAKTLEEMNSV